MKIGDYVDKATRLRSESADFTYDDLISDNLTVDELAGLWISAQEWATAARQVEKIIGAKLGELLGESKTASNVQASGYLIWFGVSTKEECVDPDGFFSWLRENPDEVSKAFNPNTARKGSIPPAVRGTFFEKTLYGEPKMQSVPVEVLKPKGSRIG